MMEGRKSILAWFGRKLDLLAAEETRAEPSAKRPPTNTPDWQAAEALPNRVTEERYQRLLESSFDAIIFETLDAVVTDWNKAAEGLFGYTDEEVIGQSIDRLLLPEDHDTEMRTLARLALGEVIPPFEARRVRKDRTVIDVSVSISPLRDASGKIVGALTIVRDISMLNKMYRERRLATDRFHSLVEQAPHGIIVVNTDGRIDLVNEQLLSDTGYRQEELLGQQVELLVPPGFRDKHVDLRKSYSTSSSVLQMALRTDLQVLRKDMTSFPADIRTTRFQSDGTDYVMVTVVNITDRKKAEVLQQKATEDRYHQLVNSSFDAIITETLEGKITSWNKAAETLLGYSESEIINQSISRVLRYEDQDREMDYLSRIQAQEVVAPFEAKRVRKDGTVIEVSVTISPLWDNMGRVVGASQIVRNISDRRAAERKLAATTAQLEAVMRSTAVGICHTMNRKIIWCNGRFASYVGYHPDELQGISTRVFYPDEETYIVSGGEPELMRHGGECIQEFRTIRRDGSSFDGRWNGRLLSSDDPSLGSIWVLEDVSAQKQVALELRRAKEAAEAAASAKSDFMANMSHEIRTPLNAVLGMAHLALRANPEPRIQNYLRKIALSGQHLLDVVNDILDFSKIESGKMFIEKVELDLNDVVRRAADMVVERCARKGVEFLLDIAEDVPQGVVGDPLRVGQILVNYLNNAVKFTERGEIILRVRVAWRDGGGIMLRFEVSDTGIGIAEEHRDKLFSSFQQADGSTTRNYGGSGLGLAIAKRLAEAMGGDVGFDSRVGVGSTFWFTALFDASDRASSQRASYPDLLGHRALIVDDSKTYRLILERLLQSFGFVSKSTESGVSALAEISRADNAGEPYGLMLLDWRMPGMDGVTVIKNVLGMKLAKSPHIMMMTSFAEDDLRAEVEPLGISEILEKPITNSMISDALYRICARQAGNVVIDVGTDARPLQSITELRGARVLLVEDNEINQEIAAEMLGDCGISLDFADNGKVALTMLEKHRYDLVLMDVQMPVMDGIEATKRIRTDLRNTAIPIIAMTASVLQSDLERCLVAGMNDHVAKPIDPDRLIGVLLKWIKPEKSTVPNPLQRNSEQLIAKDKPGSALVKTNSARSSEGLVAELTGVNVLLVEDNEINQEVAGDILKSFGVALDFADNGEVALRMLEKHRYDFVLMDVQMPIMDGIEATKRIRKDLGNAAVPIIAMTANAMHSDRERCLAAGMNDFVAKPIDPGVLQRVLMKWMRPTTVSGAMSSPKSSEESTQRGELSRLSLVKGLDAVVGLRHLGGNESLYISLLKKFAATQVSCPSKVVEALAHGDWEMAERLAHTLKGAGAVLGALEVQQAAAALEAGIRAKESQSQIDVLAAAVGALLDPLVVSLRHEFSIPEQT